MTYDLPFCPICATGQHVKPFKADWPEGFRVCNNCTLGIEVLVTDDPTGVYKPVEYDVKRNSESASPRWRRFHHDSAVAAMRFAQLDRHLPARPFKSRAPRWADVGCNNGAFLAHARRLGWDVLGVEATQEAAEQTAATVGLPVLPSTQWTALASHGPPVYDVISFYDVIEHLFDPIGTLITAGKVVNPGGLIVIEVPDFGVPLKAGTLDGWKHRRVTHNFTEHLWHFTEAALEHLRRGYLPQFDSVGASVPVDGKLQIVWRKKKEQ